MSTIFRSTVWLARLCQLQGVLGPHSLLALPLAADQAAPLVPRVPRRVRPVRGELRLAQLPSHEGSEDRQALVGFSQGWVGFITETLCFTAKKWGSSGWFHAVYISKFVLSYLCCTADQFSRFTTIPQLPSWSQPFVKTFQLKIFDWET